MGGGVYQCGCNGDEDCATSGEYCSGTSCAACTVDDNCGSNCDDCTGQANNQACVLDGSYRCGCNDINDCDTGYFCNGSSTCEVCDEHDNCGSACTDCASQVENQACIWFTDHWACGCINPSDCTDLTCTDNTCQ
jgi:hypothetical protein